MSGKIRPSHSATGKANGTPVTQNFEIHLQNGYNNYSGGFLDTRGSQAEFEKTGNLLCVSTAIDKKREGGSSGTWKVQIIKEVAIGKQQEWTTVNSNVDKFINVDPIQMPTNSKEVTNPKTGMIWMDRNLGATQVATSSTDAASYGDLYQWGRGADGHQKRTSGTTTTLSATDNPGNGSFISGHYSPHDWRSPQNTNLWQGVNGINNPCPNGYRLPTDTELNTERTSWSTKDAAGAFASPLKLPMAGYRGFSIGTLEQMGAYGRYWSSTVSSIQSRYLDFNSSNANMDTGNRAFGYSVRCLKESVDGTPPTPNVTNPKTGRIWMDRNLGATQVATSSTDEASYGDLYQWGRCADGHQKRTSGTTPAPSATDNPGHGNFIANGTSKDWRSPKNDNLWQGVNGINNPCPSGYRLPTETELRTELESWSTKDAAGAFASPLKLPKAGVRYSTSQQDSFKGILGYYWSSTVSGERAHTLFFDDSSNGSNMSERFRGWVLSVRCIKD